MAQTKVKSGGIATDAVESTAIKDLNVTADKLSNTLDLSSKTVTLPTSAIAYPTFTSITPSTTTNDSTSFVIVGTNFGATGIPTVEFQNLSGGITVATSVVRDSATQLTVVATLAVDGTYYTRIELNNGLAVRSSTAGLTISDAPVWTTGSGTLGTIAGDFSGAVATVAATGDTVTYSEVSGTGLTGAGNANCSLNSSTGAITTTDFGGSSTEGTTYNFTIRATDAQSQTSDRAFSLTSSFLYAIEWLIVAAGGGGGGGNHGSGAGAGGYRIGTSLDLNPSTVYTVTVGAGGAGGSGSGGNHSGSDGGDSILSGTGITTITSTGGGGGGSSLDGAGGTGGSGGAGGAYSGGSTTYGAAGNTPAITQYTAAGETTTVQGYNGGGNGGYASSRYPGAGGGGAGGDGQSAQALNVAGAGAAGVNSSITGASVAYAGGGGGGIYSGGTAGAATHGGGAGGLDAIGANGTVNTGGGAGGGNGGAGYAGGTGGSGVVILRIPTANYSETTTGSPTVTTDGSYKVVKFTDDGSYTA